MTLQKLVHYLEKLHEYREHVRPADLEIMRISKALFSFLGVKESEDIEEQIKKSGFPSMKVTKKAMVAWEKAGMPNSQKFFAEWRENG